MGAAGRPLAEPETVATENLKAKLTPGVSVDRSNGESTALFHKVSEKVGCEIGTRYKLLGQSEQTRMEQGDDNRRVL